MTAKLSDTSSRASSPPLSRASSPSLSRASSQSGSLSPSLSRSSSSNSIVSTASNSGHKSSCWRGFNIRLQNCSETLSKLGIHLVAGLVLQIIIPSIASPFFGYVIGACVTRFSIRVVKRWHPNFLDERIKSTREFEKKYMLLMRISILFAVCLSLISPIMGLFAGAVLGSFQGMTLGMAAAEKRRQEQQMQQEMSKKESEAV